MKKTDITEELWFDFLEGRTSEEETEQITRLMAEDDELMEEFMAVREAMQLTDAEPCQSPDLDLAQEQISQVLHKEPSVDSEVLKLPRRSNISKFFSIAAVLVVLIGVALFLLFRPDRSDNNLAQQEQKNVESVENVQNQNPATTDNTDNGRNGKSSSKHEADTVQPESSDTSLGPFTIKKMEKNYAAVQVANSLTVTKPTKDNYRVQCLNLERKLQFEWSATNVKALHFTLTDSRGKTIAETKNVAANQFSLKYGDIYPEQKLTWNLIVVFKDGTQDMRSGQIQIDYSLKKQ